MKKLVFILAMIAIIGSAQASTTFVQWLSNPQQVGDVVFTLSSYSGFNDNTYVNFFEIGGSAPRVGVSMGGSLNGPFNGASLEYTVAFVASEAPTAYFSKATLSNYSVQPSIIIGSGVLNISKTIVEPDPDIVLTRGQAEDLEGIFNSLTVSETLTGGGYLASTFTNTFYTDAIIVPEPMTLCILGLGGILLRKRG